nr:PAS domain-containing protein [Streptomyces lydicamycinicus]
MCASQSGRLSGDDVFDLTRTAVVMADRAGVAQGWTKGAERLLGYAVSEAVGRPLTELFAGVAAGAPPDNRWESRLAAADGWSGLEAVRHKDGHRLDLEFRVLPLMDAQEHSTRLVLAAEMTRTPWSGASRSFLEGILGMSPIGVAMVNADLQFVWLNDALEQMGGTSREQRLGKRLGEIQPGLAVEAIEAEMRKVLASGTPSVGYEYLGRPESDPQREHAYSTSFFRIEDEAGQVLGVCYMVLDVTESYRARQRMALLNRAGERIGSSLDVWQTAQEARRCGGSGARRLRHRRSARRTALRGGADARACRWRGSVHHAPGGAAVGTRGLSRGGGGDRGRGRLSAVGARRAESHRGRFRAVPDAGSRRG